MIKVNWCDCDFVNKLILYIYFLKYCYCYFENNYCHYHHVNDK